MKKTLVQLSGAVFILIGILGFFNNPILGLFAVNTLHNFVHIGSGILALILVAQGEKGAVLFGKIMSAIYGLVVVLEIIAPELMMKLINHNMADMVLHIVLTALFIYIGFIGQPNDNKVLA